MTAQARFDLLPPPPRLFESMRAYGYTLGTAIADLIDNSVAADSRNVWVDFAWDDGDPWISVIDDGNGMTDDELRNAMSLQSRNPRDTRESKDLGRFGLGLKTASFSQARRFTVITRSEENGPFRRRRWDLDYLEQQDSEVWACLWDPHPDAGDRAKGLEKRGLTRGTQVLLEELDRLDGKTNSKSVAADHFLGQIDRVEEHLAMVFHRFLARRNSGLDIYINDSPIKPWDPFLETHPATKIEPFQSRKLSGYEGLVGVKGFILPHKDKFDNPEDYKRAEGPLGWNSQQGFYLYRADRLIIPGDWLHLRKKKHQNYQLARIRIDIPNAMDDAWQIDVKKSAAAPPAALTDWLEGIATDVRERAEKVLRHRDAYGPHKPKLEELADPWVTKDLSGGETRYKINRKHELVDSLAKSLSEVKKQEFESLLQIVEETVPVRQVWINEESRPEPYIDLPDKELRRLFSALHSKKKQTMSPEEAWDEIETEPLFQFENAQSVLGELRNEADK